MSRESLTSVDQIMENNQYYCKAELIFCQHLAPCKAVMKSNIFGYLFLVKLFYFTQFFTILQNMLNT